MKMTLFDNILLQVIFIVFPLAVWMIYQIYMKNINRERKNITFDITLMTMTYFLLKLTKGEYSYLVYFTISIPLILAFLKRREITFLIICGINIYYFSHTFNENIINLIFECVFLYGLYQILKNKKESPTKEIQLFIFGKFIFTYAYLYTNSILNYQDIFTSILLFIVFYSCIFFTALLLKKSEDMILYSNAISLLEEEKRLQTCLFKITHEIKNPIAVCKGYLDMFDVDKEEHAHKYVPILKGEISKVLTLLQDFLSIRKIKIEKETLDIYYLLENAVDSIGPLLKEKNIHLTSLIPDDELFIDADYNRINQVVINLFKNSIEAMNETSIKELKLSTKKIKDNICIEISDSGIGISKENLEKMNEPFFTTKRSGTGLGVYLSREIMKEHGGKLNYVSKEQEGTKVILTLPIKKDILFS